MPVMDALPVQTIRVMSVKGVRHGMCSWRSMIVSMAPEHEPNPQDVIVSRKPPANANTDYVPDVFENYQAIHMDGKQRDMVHAPVPCSLS